MCEWVCAFGRSEHQNVPFIENWGLLGHFRWSTQPQRAVEGPGLVLLGLRVKVRLRDRLVVKAGVENPLNLSF